eukprot:PITA_17276
MLEAGIIEPMEESDWVNLMVVQDKKQKGEIRICVDLQKLNDACVHDPFPTSFTDEVLDNVGGIFCIVITMFKEFIYMFLEVYSDDWTVFGLAKHHVASLYLILDTCHRYQIVLTLKKCIFYVPFGILLGHVMCKQIFMVDPANIVVIVNLEAHRNVKQLRMMLGHTRYYRNFIKDYAQITTPMEKILKKDVTFYWDEECQCNLDVLKEKMVTAPILVFPN